MKKMKEGMKKGRKEGMQAGQLYNSGQYSVVYKIGAKIWSYRDVMRMK